MRPCLLAGLLLLAAAAVQAQEDEQTCSFVRATATVQETGPRDADDPLRGPVLSIEYQLDRPVADNVPRHGTMQIGLSVTHGDGTTGTLQLAFPRLDWGSLRMACEVIDAPALETVEVLDVTCPSRPQGNRCLRGID